ncbi:hypothetical protein C8J57DRAFT_1508882 [Mycena rebaudengoi]|nr:hypothetical protein C8J57DRAFT_1508882 [Mycena rebaudengoi]
MGGTPAGFIIAIQIQYTDGSSDVLGTDQTWLNGAVPSVSAFLTMADSALVSSAVLSTFGIQPWGMLNGTSNALNAASVPSIPSGNRATASPSSSPSASTSATNRPDVPGPVIIGGVMVALAVLGVVAFLILWRRKHRNLSLRLRDANVACTPFVADNPSVTNVEGKYANAIPLRNTSQWAVDAPGGEPLPRGGVEILPPNYVP